MAHLKGLDVLEQYIVAHVGVVGKGKLSHSDFVCEKQWSFKEEEIIDSGRDTDGRLREVVTIPRFRYTSGIAQPLASVLNFPTPASSQMNLKNEGLEALLIFKFLWNKVCTQQ